MFLQFKNETTRLVAISAISEVNLESLLDRLKALRVVPRGLELQHFALPDPLVYEGLRGLRSAFEDHPYFREDSRETSQVYGDWLEARGWMPEAELIRGGGYVGDRWEWYLYLTRRFQRFRIRLAPLLELGRYLTMWEDPRINKPYILEKEAGLNLQADLRWYREKVGANFWSELETILTQGVVYICPYTVEMPSHRNR